MKDSRIAVCHVRYSRPSRWTVAAALLGLAGGFFAAQPAHAAKSELSWASRSGVRGIFTSDADSARDTSSFRLEGRVLDQNDIPASGLRLTINLDPSNAMVVKATQTGTGVAGVALVDATTDSAGRFAATIPALTDLGDYLDENGQIQLLLTGNGAEVDVFYRLLVAPPKQTNAPAIVFSADEQTTRTTRVANAQLRRRLKASARQLTSLEIPALRTPRVSTRAVVLPADHNRCNNVTNDYNGRYEWRYYNSFERKWVEIARVATKTKSKVAYTWSNSRETRLSGGIDFAFRSVKTTTSRELAVVTSESRTFNIAARQNRIIQLEVRYQDATMFCYDERPVIGTNWKVAGIYALRPYDYAGDSDSSTFNADTWFSCSPNYQASYSSKRRVSADRTTVSSFSVAAFAGMSGSQKNTTSHAIEYQPATSSSYKLCGSDNIPSGALKVKEIQ